MKSDTFRHGIAVALSLGYEVTFRPSESRVECRIIGKDSQTVEEGPGVATSFQSAALATRDKRLAKVVAE